MKELFFEALKLYGQKEVEGKASNPVLLEKIKRWAGWVKDDSEIAWCSIFVNDIAKRLGYEYTNKLNARSWLNIGEPVNIEDAKPGDIVIFWRVAPNDWRGHVGLYANHNKQNVYVLGGNQANAVNIAPYSLNRLLGVRRLNKK